MNWLQSLFSTHSATGSVIIISLIIAVGMGLGKMKVRGVSLGVAFVFFIGILAGHIGLSVDPTVLDYAETFGVSMFA